MTAEGIQMQNRHKRAKLFLVAICIFVVSYLIFLINQNVQLNHDLEIPIAAEAANYFNAIFPAHTRVEYEIKQDSIEIYNIENCVEVIGISMYPSVTSGQKVCYKKFNKNEIHDGDLIIYNTRDQYKEYQTEFVLHRVIAIYPQKDGTNLYIARGDYPFSEQDKIRDEDIIGIVTTVILE